MNLYEKIIAHLRSQGKKVKDYKNYIIAQCIYPKYHENGDRTPSLKITPQMYKCFNPSCELSKGGSLYDLAIRMGLIQPYRSEFESEAIEYIKQRLRFKTAEEAKAFMQRMNIQPYTLRGTKGIKIDLFNGEAKFRSFDGKVYWHFKNINQEKFPAFFGLIDLFKDNGVFITEGTFDALTFWSLELPALSTEGNNYVKDVIKSLEAKGIGTAILAFDSDSAGYKFTEDFIRECLEHGIIPQIMNIEPYKDVNELYMIGGQEELRKRIGDCRNGFEYIVKDFDFDSPVGRRSAFIKLTTFFKLSKDKRTAEELIFNILREKGISYDEWIEELEQVEIHERIQKRRDEALYSLEKARDELQKGKSINEVFNELFMSMQKFRDLQIKTFEEDDELLEGFNEEEAIVFSFLPDIKFYPGDILLISAKTKSGKTTLALNLFHEALQNNKKAFYTTYELTKGQLFELFTALNLEKSGDSLTIEDKRAVRERFGKLGILEHNLYLEDIIAYVQVFQPYVFVVDYDQCVQVSGRFESEERRVAYITQALKKVALDSKSFCILLSQENDDGQARYSREKEFYASVHLRLTKNPDSDDIEYEVKLNRYGKAGMKGRLEINWKTRRIIPIHQEVQLK